jgi:hypothetical protein
MSDSNTTREPRDADIGTGSQLRGTRSIAYHWRRIRHDANVLAGAVQEATGELQHYLSEQVEERPFTILGVATGVGFVLGRGLPVRLTAGLLGIATRLAITVAARELSARLSSSASGVVQDEGF